MFVVAGFDQPGISIYSNGEEHFLYFLYHHLLMILCILMRFSRPCCSIFFLLPLFFLLKSGEREATWKRSEVFQECKDLIAPLMHFVNVTGSLYTSKATVLVMPTYWYRNCRQKWPQIPNAFTFLHTSEHGVQFIKPASEQEFPVHIWTDVMSGCDCLARQVFGMLLSWFLEKCPQPPSNSSLA